MGAAPRLAWTLKRHPIVDGSEGHRLAIDRAWDRSVAGQILQPPAVLGALPDLNLAILARNQEDLLDRRDCVACSLEGAGGRSRAV